MRANGRGFLYPIVGVQGTQELGDLTKFAQSEVSGIVSEVQVSGGSSDGANSNNVPRNPVHRRRNNYTVLTLSLDTTLWTVFFTNVQDTRMHAPTDNLEYAQFQM